MDSTNQLLTEILAVLQHIGNAERGGAVSSVKVTLQRGTIDVACHAYVGSDIREAEDEAIASYRRTIAALNQDGVDSFAKEVARRT
jgi:hypothetical protein